MGDLVYIGMGQNVGPRRFTMSANVNSMMYNGLGGIPWHKEGTMVAGLSTAEEAIKAAGLDWTVSKSPLYVNEGGAFKAVPDMFVARRDDTGALLGGRSVGSVFAPLQNREAFSFFDAIVGEKAAIYETAGALGAGERVWLLAKLPGTIRVVGDDTVDKYLLLSNRHDGQGSVEILWTPIRVVCQNTLNGALGSAKDIRKARHTRTIGLRVESIRKGLGIVNEAYDTFAQGAQALTKVQVNAETFRALVEKSGLIPTAKEGADGEGRSTRALNILEEVEALFAKGRGNDLPGVKGTAWGAYNALTEYVDWERNARGGNRATSALFGSGAAVKAQAWAAAVALI